MIAEIVNSYSLNLDFLRRLVADLSDEQMTAQPNGVTNHPAWTIGHLVYSCEAIGGEIGLTAWLSEEWNVLFRTGSEPVENPNLYPAKSALLKAIDDGQRRVTTALAAMSERDMAAPLPDERHRGTFPTVGHAVIHILSAHTAFHVGQVAVWRRAMELPPVPELEKRE